MANIRMMRPETANLREGKSSTAVDRGVIQTRTGIPAGVVVVDRVEAPQPGHGELLVELALSPINPTEVRTAKGNFGYRETVSLFSRISGIEGIGRVVSGAMDAVPVGWLISLVDTSPIFADYRLISAASALEQPDGIDHESFACSLINTQAVLTILHDSPATMPPGWIIQNEANSDHGRILDAVAAKRGIPVINVVRSESAVAIIGDSAINRLLADGPDLEQHAADQTGGARTQTRCRCRWRRGNWMACRNTRDGKSSTLLRVDVGRGPHRRHRTHRV